MHISDGVVTESQSGRILLAVTSLLALAGTTRGLRRLHPDQIPRVAVVACVFFVASLVPLKLGPTSAHFGLMGLAGLLLGWSAYPAILVGITLQAVFFGHGGLTTIGINTFNIALGAMLGGALLQGPLRRAEGRRAHLLAFLAGALPVFFISGLVALELRLTDPNFAVFAGVVVLSHLPIALAEGLITAAAVSFLRQVRPETLQSEPCPERP